MYEKRHENIHEKRPDEKNSRRATRVAVCDMRNKKRSTYVYEKRRIYIYGKKHDVKISQEGDTCGRV